MVIIIIVIMARPLRLHRGAGVVGPRGLRGALAQGQSTSFVFFFVCSVYVFMFFLVHDDGATSFIRLAQGQCIIIMLYCSVSLSFFKNHNTTNTCKQHKPS